VQPTATSTVKHYQANDSITPRAPKVHGELWKLGFVVSERTVARYLLRIRQRGDPGKRWLAFLQNHREVIVAFDFFAVPTLTFQLLYCFFVIEHALNKGASSRQFGSFDGPRQSAELMAESQDFELKRRPAPEGNENSGQKSRQ
jgi:hypothetical protein